VLASIITRASHYESSTMRGAGYTLNGALPTAAGLRGAPTRGALQGQCSDLLYTFQRSHRCTVHRNRRDGVSDAGLGPGRIVVSDRAEPKILADLV
jgi:hypothetical protein